MILEKLTDEAVSLICFACNSLSFFKISSSSMTVILFPMTRINILLFYTVVIFTRRAFSNKIKNGFLCVKGKYKKDLVMLARVLIIIAVIPDRISIEI